MRSKATRILTVVMFWTAATVAQPVGMVDAGSQPGSDTDEVGAAPEFEALKSSPNEIERPDRMSQGEPGPSERNLDEIEQKMHSLRGQVQNLKSEILTLGEQISSGFVTGTKLLIVHHDALGGAFEIENIEYKLDGFTVYSNQEPAKLQATNDLIIFDANILPGNHTVDVVYTLRGTGYGVFTYMEDYTFDMRNQYHFATPRGKAVELNVEAVDRGSGENLRDRPQLKFTVR